MVVADAGLIAEWPPSVTVAHQQPVVLQPQQVRWQAPDADRARSIGVWGLPSHLLRLKDDRLLMSYGYRRRPFGNQARISDDHGKTWSAPITISSDGANGDLGYPTTIELDDGTLLTAWYEQLSSSPRAVLRLARWNLL